MKGKQQGENGSLAEQLAEAHREIFREKERRNALSKAFNLALSANREILRGQRIALRGHRLMLAAAQRAGYHVLACADMPASPTDEDADEGGLRASRIIEGHE